MKTPKKMTKSFYEGIWRPRDSSRGGLLDIYYCLNERERAEVLQSTGLVKNCDFLKSLDFNSYTEARTWFIATELQQLGS